MKLRLLLCLILALSLCLFALTACGGGNTDGTGDGGADETPDGGADETPDGGTGETPDDGEKYETITIAEALELCGAEGNITTERYYIRATVDAITDARFGAMIISDETGTISVYGTYSADGSIGYAEFEEQPYRGDEVLLHCILQNYNGTKEVKNARLIEFKRGEISVNEEDYTEMSVSSAREAKSNTLVKLSGTVARITYALGQKPSGFYLVDGGASIYVYDVESAGRVKIGDTVTILGTKAYWILETEAQNAEKYGYRGCCQIDRVARLTINSEGSLWDKSWVKESTVKDILDTPFSEDITTTIFKVNAVVRKKLGDNFVNYYFNDLDDETGTYTYTQCNGADFAWLDQFDGKICTVYLSVLNAKSTSSGCNWRVIPIEVIDEGYKFDTAKTAEHVVNYYGLTQLESVYTGDPALKLETKFSSELLGFTDATVAFASSDDTVISFTDEDGTLVMHCLKAGKATVTVSASYGGVNYEKALEITVRENVEIDALEVADAIKAPIDTDISVVGIVGPSLVNQTGFYLFGDDGSMIAVKLNSSDELAGVAIGHRIVVSGMRERYVKDDSYDCAGQTCIVNATVVANYYGEHEYPTDKVITNMTPEDFYNLDATVDHSTEIYRFKVTVEITDEKWAQPKLSFTKADGTKGQIGLYCSGKDQYAFLKAYNGQEITVEIAPCNWNNKSFWVGCVLAIYTSSGEKILNTLNFDI